MLFECNRFLEESLKAAEGLSILRHDGESDEDYAERAIKIAQLSEEIPKLFLDRSLDIGSVIDAVTIGLASVISANYKDESSTIDPYITTLLSDRIRYFRSESGQNQLPEWTDEDIKSFIKKFRLIDRPIGGKESEKITYARRVLRAIRTIESALVVSDVTDFDVIEAFCVELSTIFSRGPLPDRVIKDLLARIPKNVQFLKENDSEE